MKKYFCSIFLCLMMVCAGMIFVACGGNNNQKVEFNIQYELNGGELIGENPTKYTVGKDDDFQLIAPSQDDNEFLGWYFNGNIENKIEKLRDIKKYRISSDDITLKAIWKWNDINSVEDFINLNSEFGLIGSKKLELFYRLKNDLDFSEINDFEPIGGFQSTSFKGTFDGCGHTISNINIIPQIYSKNSVGLFANLDGATIKNLNIKNFSTYLPNGTYYIGESKVGALAGNANNSIVENVTCENILVGSSVFYNPSAKAYLGGLVGYITGESKISHCCIKGNNNIIFRNYNTKSIETSHVGGLVGYSEADIESCYVECNISVNRIRNYLAETNYTKQYFGGLIGKNSGNVTQSYAVGSFDVSNCYQFFYFGGLVGYNTGLISNTFNNFILVHVEDITNAWSLVRSESIVGSVLAYDTNEFENVENNYYISNFDNFIFNKTNTGIRIEDKALLNNETYMQETLMFTDEIWNFNTTYPSFD